MIDKNVLDYDNNEFKALVPAIDTKSNFISYNACCPSIKNQTIPLLHLKKVQNSLS